MPLLWDHVHWRLGEENIREIEKRIEQGEVLPSAEVALDLHAGGKRPFIDFVDKLVLD